jgi:hypothetical protein
VWTIRKSAGCTLRSGKALRGVEIEKEAAA